MPQPPAPEPWADALQAALLLAVDPSGLGGVLLRARHGPQRSAWLAVLRQLLPQAVPMRRAPLGISDERLLGGLDLTATLQAGRPVAQRGLLAECNGGLVQLALAERLSAGTAARLAAVLDRGEVQLQREGLAATLPARIGLVALDEGIDDDEATPAALADRLALHLALDGLPPAHPPLQDVLGPDLGDRVMDARARLNRVQCSDEVLAALCNTALGLGIASLRAPLLAVRAARAAAALRGQTQVKDEDAVMAARLVLAPRATQWPAPPQDADAEAQPSEAANTQDPPQEPPPEASGDAPPPPPAPPPEQAGAEGAVPPAPPNVDAQADPPALPEPGAPLQDLLLEAAQAALPAGLLAQLKAGLAPRGPSASGGRAGALQPSGARGRPTGARRGSLRRGQRLDLVATLRAAAPWQVLRQREALAATPQPARRVLVQPDDFHVRQHAERRETTTVFVVDASGSSAMNRLAEAKGAVEQLLADCYVRRDRVALLVFRGSTAELVLPPTRSLVRAKRALAGQPGGGGTPLASAIDAAAELTRGIARRGGTPVLVLLTDGRANIDREGRPGRAKAQADALASAQRLRAAGVATLLVDTSPPLADLRAAQALAVALGGVHLPLPKVDAARLSRLVQGMAQSARGA